MLSNPFFKKYTRYSTQNIYIDQKFTLTKGTLTDYTVHRDKDWS